jgi:hypothetical protein
MGRLAQASRNRESSGLHAGYDKNPVETFAGKPFSTPRMISKKINAARVSPHSALALNSAHILEPLGETFGLANSTAKNVDARLEPKTRSSKIGVKAGPFQGLGFTSPGWRSTQPPARAKIANVNSHRVCKQQIVI